ncbi:hypothetical protein B6I21_07825 [candidate division KSB1 bacterium 4572_119]|nr:MAG: hypothetical protein B6I21_07825 [candidate division KSB1 bacterium 4572_119]
MRIILIVLLLLYAYPVGFFLGSYLLRKILIFTNEAHRDRLGGSGINFRNTGFWIGLCEHFLVVTFILAEQYTALGIIVAARGLLRLEDIKQDKTSTLQTDKASYYLLGMLLSVSFAVFFGTTTKFLIEFLA